MTAVFLNIHLYGCNLEQPVVGVSVYEIHSSLKSEKIVA